MASTNYYQLDNYRAHRTYSPPPQEFSVPTSQSSYRLQDTDDTTYHGPPPSSLEPLRIPLNPKDHLQSTEPNPLPRLSQQKLQKWKRFLRIVRTATKAVSLLFSAVMFGIMVYITGTYQSTKDDFRGGRNAWPKSPKLWPTIMLLIASGITLLLSVITLLSYCISFQKARRSWKLTIVKYVIHILAWAVVSVLYRYEKSLHGDANDLWGWSCSQKAQAIQGEFNGVVDFNSLCRVQVVILWYRQAYKSKADHSVVQFLDCLDCGIWIQGRFCRWAFYHLSEN